MLGGNCCRFGWVCYFSVCVCLNCLLVVTISMISGYVVSDVFMKCLVVLIFNFLENIMFMLKKRDINRTMLYITTIY